MEPSSDELVGLITGLFFVWGFLPDPQKAAAAAILGELAEYLAEHSYFLVRPAGGFSSRGPAAGSVAGEYASQRVFARILGDLHAARHDVPTVLASAGLWPSLEADWNTDILLELAVVQPLLLAAIEPLFGPLGALGLGAVDGAASAFLQALNEAGLNPVTMGGAWSLGRGNQLMFDCETRIADDGVTVNEDYPQEIALGTLLNGVSAAARLQLYMGVWGAVTATGWAVGFLPFLGADRSGRLRHPGPRQLPVDVPGANQGEPRLGAVAAQPRAPGRVPDRGRAPAGRRCRPD